MKRRVLHLLSSGSFSGAENVVCQIMDLFRDCERYEMVYCSLDGPIKEALAERNVDFIALKSMTVNQVRKAISAYKPDIIHAHDMKAGFLAALVCGRVPLISHIHNNSFASRKLTAKVLLYSFAAWKAKHIFWVSDSAYKDFSFRSAFEVKSSVLHNIIDPQKVRLKALEAADHSAYDVAFLGRLSYPKNPQRLINVLESVVQQRPGTMVAVMGSGEMDEEIKAMVDERGLAENIHLMGFVNNPHGIMSQSKVMIMTSRWEGTPMCVLEAMALGVPIVSTPVDGLAEVIVHGENGFLSEDNAQLARYIVQLLDSEEMREKMSIEQKRRSLLINDTFSYREKLLAQYEA